MAKHKTEGIEYMGEWDDGTYQTGAIQPPKHSSGLVAVLLMAVIFLGSLCSMMGILNVRLLHKLSQMDQETTPLSMAPHFQPPVNNFLEDLDEPEPQIPSNRSVKLQIVQSPYYATHNQSGNVLNAQQIYDRNLGSMVKVQCLNHFGDTLTGVGLVMTSDGYILSNHHTVDAARRIFVTLSDGTTLRAALVGSDSFSDLAVLYVQAEGLTPAVFSNNKTLQVTDPSFAISADQSITQSSVFSVSRLFAAKSNTISLIQTCHGGTSGPVFDSFGNVMGFQTNAISQFFRAEDTVGTGLVVPTQVINQIVSELVRHGHVTGRPRLGIQVEAISKVYQQYWQLPVGLLLTGVEQNSNAALSGLEEGDILLALDGMPISKRSDLYAALYDHNVGDTIVAVVCRDNQKFTVQLTIEDHKKQ